MDKTDEGTPVTGGSFHRLGRAAGFRLFVGKQPDSLIFQVQIDHPEHDEPYIIEFFAEPDTAMGLLRMLAEAAQRENYRIPAGSIEPKRFQ